MHLNQQKVIYIPHTGRACIHRYSFLHEPDEGGSDHCCSIRKSLQSLGASLSCGPPESAGTCNASCIWDT